MARFMKRPLQTDSTPVLRHSRSFSRNKTMRVLCDGVIPPNTSRSEIAPPVFGTTRKTTLFRLESQPGTSFYTKTLHSSWTNTKGQLKTGGIDTHTLLRLLRATAASSPDAAARPHRASEVRTPHFTYASWSCAVVHARANTRHTSSAHEHTAAAEW